MTDHKTNSDDEWSPQTNYDNKYDKLSQSQTYKMISPYITIIQVLIYLILILI